MPSQTSLFLFDNIFDGGDSYHASLVTTTSDTSVLAFQCTGHALQATPSCPPGVNNITVTIAPTSIGMTYLSPAATNLATIVETCTVTAAKSSAHCQITALGGVDFAYTVDPTTYAKDLVTLNITNIDAQTTATASSSATATTAPAVSGSTTTATSAATTATATTATTSTNSTSNASALTTTASGKSLLTLLAVWAMSAVIGM